MAQEPQQFVSLSHGRVHYRAAGPSDGPVVVLIHGFSFASWCFNFLGPLLEDAGYRVFAPDLYGRGFSDRPDVRHDRGLYNQMLAEFLDAVGVEEQAVLVGNSMGGAIVADFAAHYPGQVRGLVLVVTAGLRLSRPMSLGWLGVPVIGDLIWRWIGPDIAGSSSPDPVVREMANAAVKQQAEIPGYYAALLSTLRNFPLDGMGESFETLSIQGTPVHALFSAKDALIPVESAEVLSALIPRATVEVVDDASHDLVMEQPQRVAAAVAKLISPDR